MFFPYTDSKPFALACITKFSRIFLRSLICCVTSCNDCYAFNNNHITMKTLKVISSFFLLLSAHSNAAWQERELNTWYEKDKVLYDITQTVDDNPVMISIAQAGFKKANLALSYMSNGGCSDHSPPLRINNTIVPAAYKCVPMGKNKIEHYFVDDADKVNALVGHLKSDFTAVIQGDIKLWAANIKSPKYGMTPKF